MMCNLQINGKAISAFPSTSILQAANKLGITIPTMCYMEGLPHSTSCMICVVEDINTGKLLPSCSAHVEEGMCIETDNARVREFRKDTLDLLLSEHIGDCQAPCQRVCPAFMNIPLMIRQIQQKDWPGAIRTVKKDIALPAVLGRICPAPCENGCNRRHHDEAVSICLLKRIVADIDLQQVEPFKPDGAADSGHRVAIVGAGPAGLSAAYYLAQSGHRCTLFDKHEQPGGNLCYAIPQDRLAKAVLDAEIAQIVLLGIELRMEHELGRHFQLSELRNEFDALVLATGDIDAACYATTELQSTARGLKVDRQTFATNVTGVFAGGSLVSPSQMAVRAVGHGRTIAYSVDQYLKKQAIIGRPTRFSSLMGRLQDGEIEQFLQDASMSSRLAPTDGVETGFTEEEAVREAQRCLHCDCRKQESCKLRLYSDEYRAEQNRFKTGSRKAFERHVQHDLVIFEPGKCIKCGLCVEIAAAAGEKLGLTFINRGFDVRIAIPFNEALQRGLEKVAAECAAACPTAAISLRNQEETV
ncbi:FAD-dependent oxidoreductase [candidate division KSB1 bacterium]|nr:FAD-dependent oxidoreductase [candidate division KSB1 bacterium]